jgi:pyruvate ferredoxin oxidoreductase beta subunit
MTQSVVKIGKREITTQEFYASGHRGCIGCGEMLAVRLTMKALGRDVVVANATGCIEIVSSPLPTTAWEVPWFHSLFENTAAVASGIESGFKAMMRKGRIPQKQIHVIAIAGDGGTADIGIQALSGAMERGHDFVYICFDNEAYMNTGIQRSSCTPYGASTSTAPAGKKSIGQTTWKKNMAEIAVAHGIPYVATATASYPFDLMEKVKKAADIKGPAYVHVFSVCDTGWRTPSNQSVAMGRLAVQTGVFPLYEVENGNYKMNVAPATLKPVAEYLKKQGRFRHLSDAEIQKIQNKVNEDYAKLKEKVARSQNPA